MKIAFVFAGGRESRWDDALAGRVPSDFFYGAVELARAGHAVTCHDAPDPRRSLFAAVYNRFCDRSTPVRTRGEHVAATRKLLPRLREVDVVVAASTSHANALAIWKRRGRLRARLVGIHCGHVNFPLEGARQRATARAMAGQEVVLFADAEREATIRLCGAVPDRVHANPYGVDVAFWNPAPRPSAYLLAVGNDGRRDYRTLVEAVTPLAIPTKILTKRPLPELPPHVENLRGSWHAPAVSDEELRELYRGAIAVVVPLENSLQPSGQSVALQAMACGRPVILTRTDGLWTGVAFVEGRDLLLVEPGSPEALREQLGRLVADPEAREEMGRHARIAALAHGRIDDFARRLEAVCISARL